MNGPREMVTLRTLAGGPTQAQAQLTKDWEMETAVRNAFHHHSNVSNDEWKMPVLDVKE